MLTYQNNFDFFLIVLEVSNGLGFPLVSDTSEPEMKQTCLPIGVNKTQPGSTPNPCNSVRTHITTVIYIHTHMWPGSSVGIVTDYGLNGPGSNPGGDENFRPSRPVQRLTQPPVK